MAEAQRRLEEIVLNHKTEEFLERFTLEEMVALRDKLVKGKKSKELKEGDRTTLIDDILIEIGLFTTPRQFQQVTSSSQDSFKSELERKIHADEFDVFMAHNSQDKPDCLGSLRCSEG